MYLMYQSEIKQSILGCTCRIYAGEGSRRRKGRIHIAGGRCRGHLLGDDWSFHSRPLTLFSNFNNWLFLSAFTTSGWFQHLKSRPTPNWVFWTLGLLYPNPRHPPYYPLLFFCFSFPSFSSFSSSFLYLSPIAISSYPAPLYLSGLA